MPWEVKVERGREKTKGQGLIPDTFYRICFPSSKTTLNFFRKKNIEDKNNLLCR